MINSDGPDPARGVSSMTVLAPQFTPEVLLTAPRRSPATPNSTGTLALYTVSTYSFQTHAKTAEIRILDILTGHSKLITNDSNASEPTWLGHGDLILYLLGGEKGMTKLVLGDVSSNHKPHHTLAVFDGPVGNIKVSPLTTSTFAFAITGQATPSGNLFNPSKTSKSRSSAKIYDTLFVRQWDSYVTENKNSIWFGIVKKSGDKYTLSPLTNALKQKPGSKVLQLESPVPPFGGGDNFDISRNGLVFIAKDPKIDAANFTKTDLYYLPLDFTESEAPSPVVINTGDLRGYCGSPTFSPDAKSLAFTRMKSDQYESDKPRLLVIPDITDLNNVQEFFQTSSGEGAWDRSPGSILWSRDGKDLYLTAEEYGRVKLWTVPSSPRLAKGLPTPLTAFGAIADVKPLAANSDLLFLSSTSFIDNSAYSIFDPRASAGTIQTNSRLVSSMSQSGSLFGLHQSQVSEIWYKGAGDYDIHAWVLKPSYFDPTKRYPLAYLIHGGPQGAWNESWSTRWNPAIFAEAGYIVVTPNPTGSTGYGMSLTNGIRNQWGGRPYEDLVKGFEYIENEMAYVDIKNAVALGASYGGYMMNWIQGHPLGRKFKALVTHDGVFSTLNQYSSEELFFPQHDFAGTLWDNRDNYERWDPARFTSKWATPHLVIHNELDYRLPISEGLAVFNVLQSKKIPSRFVSFPDENHWVLKPENSLVWHREVLNWINKYSGIDKQEGRSIDPALQGHI